jgi:hypothetical protein
MKIFRSLCSALFGMLLLAGAASPGDAQQGLELGFRGGTSVASASVEADATVYTSSRTGLTGGVFLNLHEGLLGVEVGAQYTQKGVGLEINNEFSHRDLTYVEFPAVVKLGMPVGVLKPSVFGGGGLGFAIECDAGEGVNCSEDIKGTEWTAIAGADVALYLGTVSLWADGRYHFGLTDVTAGGETVTSLKNRNWTFQVGIAVVIQYFGGV